MTIDYRINFKEAAHERGSNAPKDSLSGYRWIGKMRVHLTSEPAIPEAGGAKQNRWFPGGHIQSLDLALPTGRLASDPTRAWAGSLHVSPRYTLVTAH